MVASIDDTHRGCVELDTQPGEGAKFTTHALRVSGRYAYCVGLPVGFGQVAEVDLAFGVDRAMPHRHDPTEQAQPRPLAPAIR